MELLHVPTSSICSDYGIPIWHARCKKTGVIPIKHELSSAGQAALGFTLLGLVLVAQIWTKGVF